MKQLQRNLAVLTWLRLIRVAQKISHLGAVRVQQLGLSGAQFDLLVEIAGAEGISQQVLAEKLLVTKGNISQLLAKLEQNGLVVRKPSGVTNELYLSDQAKQLVADALPQHDQFITAMMRGLSQQEQQQLYDLLRKLEHSIA
jgi:DNA-binding MarR family transcriptional regulator